MSEQLVIYCGLAFLLSMTIRLLMPTKAPQWFDRLVRKIMGWQ